MPRWCDTVFNDTVVTNFSTIDRLRTGYCNSECISRDDRRFRREQVKMERVGLIAVQHNAIPRPLIKSPSPM